MKLLIEKFKNSRYETDPKIKKEFGDFLYWYQAKVARGEFAKNDIQNAVNTYFQEMDFALCGNISKTIGTNTRNSTKELCIVIGAAIIGMALVLILIYFNINPIYLLLNCVKNL